jgi:hypothetical protein
MATTKQIVIAAFIIAFVCCGVMWMLEDFRQSKMIADFRSELAKLPTYLKEQQS